MMSIYQFIIGYPRTEAGFFSFPSSCSLCSMSAIMRADDTNPSRINSLGMMDHVADINDLNKKRKFQSEVFGLPIAKHQCWGGSLPLKILSPLNENPKVEDSDSHTTIQGTTEGEADDDDGSDHESVNDSSSFMEDSDSVSDYVESKLNLENGKAWPSRDPSSSSPSWGSSSLKDSSNSSPDTAMPDGPVDKDRIAIVHEGQLPCPVDGLVGDESLDDHLIGYGSHIYDLYPGYGDDADKQYTAKEIEEVLNSGNTNAKNLVLSSGRWVVGQENTNKQQRKPTIDQEFEEYFSMLML